MAIGVLKRSAQSADVTEATEAVEGAGRSSAVPNPYRCSGGGRPYVGCAVVVVPLFQKCGFVAKFIRGGVRFMRLISEELLNSGTALSFGNKLVAYRGNTKATTMMMIAGIIKHNANMMRLVVQY